jgi:transcriptional regulator with XRE-family HTH domain
MADSILGFVAVTPDEKRFYQALGARIAGLRQDRDLSQQQLAEALGIAQQTLAHYEVGRSRVAVSLLPDIASHLGVSVPALMGSLAKTYDPRKAKPKAKRGS